MSICFKEPAYSEYLKKKEKEKTKRRKANKLAKKMRKQNYK